MPTHVQSDLIDNVITITYNFSVVLCRFAVSKGSVIVKFPPAFGQFEEVFVFNSES